MLYLAYGSNLCLEHMKRRCPAAKPVCRQTVTDAALLFRGVADVTLRKGGIVQGGLWKITRRCEEELDRFEGVANGLYLKRYMMVTLPGEDWKRDCLFYQMRTNRGIMPPTDAYLRIIRQGYLDFGLDLTLLDRALMESWGTKEVTPMLRERHIRRGKPKLARCLFDA